MNSVQFIDTNSIEKVFYLLRIKSSKLKILVSGAGATLFAWSWSQPHLVDSGTSEVRSRPKKWRLQYQYVCFTTRRKVWGGFGGIILDPK